jgi:hypothetical protein
MKTYIGNISSDISTLTANSLAVASILFDETQQPPDTLLVVVVLLALDDNLLTAEDELVAAFLGEVLLGEELVRAILLFGGAVLVLVGDGRGDVLANIVLQKRSA